MSTKRPFSLANAISLAQRAEPYIRQGYRAYKRMNGQGGDTKRRRLSTENYVTTQHDSKAQYVRKRMPYKKRKRWSKFSKKVRYVLDKSLGTNTIVFNDAITSTGYQTAVNTTTWQGPQCVAMACLFGAGGSTGTTGNTVGQSDLKQIFEQGNEPLMGKIRIKSAVLDLTLSARYSDANTQNLEVDVYHVIAKGYGKKTDSGLNDLVSVMKDTWQTIDTNPSSATRVTGIGRGETLFDVPGLLKTCQWQIRKKTKLFIPAGGQVTYQIRDSKDHVINGASFRTQTAANTMQYKGLTQFIVFVAKPIIGFSPTVGNPLFQLGVTRKYTYAVLENNSSSTAKI